MSGDSLSQEEIAALMADGAPVDDDRMAAAAAALGALVGRPVTITAPDGAAAPEPLGGPAVVAVVEHADGMGGRGAFALGAADAWSIADLMTGGEGVVPDEPSDLQRSAIADAIGRMTAAAAGPGASEPAVSLVDDLDADLDLGPSGSAARASLRLVVGGLLDTTIAWFEPVAGAEAPADEPAEALPPVDADPGHDDDDRRLRALSPPVAQPVTFPSLDQVPAPPGAGDIGLLLDVPLQVTVELGRTQLRIRNVLELMPGSIIELDKVAGEPVDVLVNGKQIARGEVVVIDEEFGVRITDVASQAKRLRGLAADGG